MYFKGIDHILTTLASFSMSTATNNSISPNIHAVVWKISNIHQETRKSTPCLNIIAPETTGNCNLFTSCQTSNISRTLIGNNIVDHSGVVGASPVQLHLHSRFNTCLQLIGHGQLQDDTRIIQVFLFGASYIRCITVHIFNAACGDVSISHEAFYRKIS